jgi:O-antigen/teichoic acid export membrane protein
MWMPYQMMLAHGWTSLTVKINFGAVLVLVPAILWVVPHYGAVGAAWMWVALNSAYLMINISLMHRRLLRGEKWRWYRQDVALPLAAAVCTAFLCRQLTPAHLSKVGELGVLVATSACVLFASASAAPEVRSQIARHFSAVARPVASSTA